MSNNPKIEPEDIGHLAEMQFDAQNEIEEISKAHSNSPEENPNAPVNMERESTRVTLARILLDEAQKMAENKARTNPHPMNTATENPEAGTNKENTPSFTQEMLNKMLESKLGVKEAGKTKALYDLGKAVWDGERDPDTILDALGKNMDIKLVSQVMAWVLERKALALQAQREKNAGLDAICEAFSAMTPEKQMEILTNAASLKTNVKNQIPIYAVFNKIQKLRTSSAAAKDASNITTESMAPFGEFLLQAALMGVVDVHPQVLAHLDAMQANQLTKGKVAANLGQKVPSKKVALASKALAVGASVEGMLRRELPAVREKMREARVVNDEMHREHDAAMNTVNGAVNNNTGFQNAA